MMRHEVERRLRRVPKSLARDEAFAKAIRSASLDLRVGRPDRTSTMSSRFLVRIRIR